MMPIALCTNFLLGTLNGLLISSVSLYEYLWFFGDVKPFTAAQLVVWFSGLANEVKSSIITALITVVGFFVAFGAATSGWKEQARATLQISIADEIERFYDEVGKLITSMQIYAESVVNEINRIRSEKFNPENSLVLEISIKDAVLFREKRKRLSAMSIEVYRLSSKHSSLLLPISGALQVLNDCEESLKRITEVMWIHLPDVSLDGPTPRTYFSSNVDLEEWSKFINVCENEDEHIGGLVGMLRGLLFAPFAKVTFSVATNLLKKSDELEYALKKVKVKSK
jgi:hypothetical protein